MQRYAYFVILQRKKRFFYWKGSFFLSRIFANDRYSLKIRLVRTLPTMPKVSLLMFSGVSRWVCQVEGNPLVDE